MDWLFGKRLTPEELLRKNQRALNKAMRDLDREKMKMEQQEKKIIGDIKKLAKEGQMVRLLTPFTMISKSVIFKFYIQFFEEKFICIFHTKIRIVSQKYRFIRCASVE